MAKKKAAPFYPTYPQFVDSLQAYTNAVNLLAGALETVLQIPEAMGEAPRKILQERLSALREAEGADIQ